MTKGKTLTELSSLLKYAQNRNAEIRQATATYPNLEIGEAYRKWKEARGEKAEMLSSTGIEKIKKTIEGQIDTLRRRPCTRAGCDGTQILESVCTGCIEGQAGYKSKWTCEKCLHRDLTKKDYWECLQELSTSQKVSS